MNPLIIEGKEKTPFFKLMPSGELSFGGTSIPEDAATFYFPIIDWFSDYYRTPGEETQIQISFKYLNSASSSMIHKIMHMLGRLQETGKTTISCQWYYELEDTDMLDFAKSMQDLAPEIKFTFQAKSD